MTKLHKEQLLLGRYLWERVKVTDYTNTQALDALGKITWHLQEAFEGKYYGFMWHLNMWIGLKPDVHDNWDKFGEGFRQDNPEYFAESIHPPKITINMAKVDSKLHPEQLMLGRYLWERVRATDFQQKESLTILGTLAYNLIDSFSSSVHNSFLFELNVWAGLKRDLRDNSLKYGDDVRQDNPEYFEGVAVKDI